MKKKERGVFCFLGRGEHTVPATVSPSTGQGFSSGGAIPHRAYIRGKISCSSENRDRYAATSDFPPCDFLRGGRVWVIQAARYQRYDSGVCEGLGDFRSIVTFPVFISPILGVSTLLRRAYPPMESVISNHGT